jgi:hypothetical protein
MKPGVFSISINQRLDLDAIGNIVEAMTTSNASVLGFLIRDTLLNAADYTEAKGVFMNDPLIAPVYVIMAGSHSLFVLSSSTSSTTKKKKTKKIY